MQKLLRVLPDLTGVGAQREPETDQVRLQNIVSDMWNHTLSTTHEDEDDRTEVHQALDSRLVERVVHRIRVLVVAVLADPWLGEGRAVVRRASVTDELELQYECSVGNHHVNE